ncbi:MAG TPA: GNAT family N-acetyltransferase [Ilumatobacteraceae bacterium]
MEPHLAQLNIATLRHPMDDPRTAGFADGLPIVNSAGDESPGFVWRLQSDTGNATDIQVFEDPLVIVNLTVWTSIEALKAFAFRGVHREFFRRRAEWFVEGSTRTALWWISAADRPTTGDAKRRLDFVEAFGASPYTFQFGQVHPVLTMRRASADEAGVRRLMSLQTSADDRPTAEDCVVVAEINGEPAAFGWYRTVGSTVAEIQRIHVPLPARAMRIGAAIVAELESAAQAAGLQRLRLETVPKQLEAYERFGFVTVDRADDHGRADIVCMEKTLAPSPCRLA